MDSSPTAVIETAPPVEPSADPEDLDADGESPLDNANFLSFEEWKKQNLEKAGQSPDSVGQTRTGAPGGNEARRRPGITNALDSLGEDQEIELDFGGFGSSNKADDAERASATSVASGEQATVAATSRSKDAGKTCKERFNYASFDCAATILKANLKAKSASSVLVENKDSYMLNECHIDNKFIIVELCNDILIDTVVLANFEFFSSMFRTFRLSVSDRYPVKMERWRELGTFEARNSREVQAFLVENPLIWARYLRIEFLEHYGNEFYCPLSLVRVHGTTMLEEYRHQEEAARDEELAIEEVAEDVIKAEDAQKRDEEVKMQVPMMNEPDKNQGASATEESTQSSETPTSQRVAEPTSLNQDGADDGSPPSSTTIVAQPSWSADAPSAIVFKRDPTPTCANPAYPPDDSTESAVHQGAITDSTSTSSAISQSIPSVAPSPSTAPTNSLSTPEASEPARQHPNPSSINNSISSPSQSFKNTTVSLRPSTTSSSQNSTRPSQTLNPASSPSPPTQESFFKSVHKRLQTLESNSTLSLQYIESQSRILRDAFASAQRRQLARTEAFLARLNATVVGELAGCHAQYDQLWQSTVIELSEGRARSRREVEELLVRLGVLADEVVWQKRVGMAQGVLVLVCLGMVIFARSGGGGGTVTGTNLDMSKSGEVGKRRLGVRLPWESPERSPESTVRARWGLGKRGSWFAGEESGRVSRAMSEGEGDGEVGTSDASADERSVRDRKGRSNGLLTPDFSRPTTAGRSESPDHSSAARSISHETQSSPATPNGLRDLQGVQGWEQAVGGGSVHRGGGDSEAQQSEKSGERSGANG
ncbi:MAG: hypothetical protein M1821_008839 [Bathelium mastoideum]|nr:MAG: hypothetical protein M1821_008839 [Bathelium mastoideum]